MAGRLHRNARLLCVWPCIELACKGQRSLPCGRESWHAAPPKASSFTYRTQSLSFDMPSSGNLALLLSALRSFTA